MRQTIFLAAAMFLPTSGAQSSVVAPIEHGVWISAQAIPAALTKGDYADIKDLLTSETTINADDGKVLAKGAADILTYLKQWYGKGNRVVATYPGYASLLISVERNTDRPWSKAYMMVISCASGKITRIMIVNRNPNMP